MFDVVDNFFYFLCCFSEYNNPLFTAFGRWFQGIFLIGHMCIFAHLFWMLGHVGNISSNAYSSSLMALGAIPLSTYVEKAKKLISLCAFTKKRKEFVCVHHVCVIAALMTTLNQCSDS